MTNRREKLYNAHENKVANFDSALKRVGNLLVAFVITGTNYITRISFAYRLFEIVFSVVVKELREGLCEDIRLDKRQYIFTIKNH